MHTKISLTYKGPAVDGGQMDVYDAAANMVAFSEFVVAAAKAAFGDGVSAKAEVSGYRHGSFATEIAFQVIGASATVWSGVTPQELWLVVRGAIALWKHLKGNPPKAIAYAEQTATVTNSDGHVIQIQAHSVTLVMSEKGSEAVGRFVHTALEKPGMDAVELAPEGQRVERISQAESGYFTSVRPVESTADYTTRMSLTIESPVFKDGNKWRFHDGSQSFHADIQDPEFIQRVNNGERFGKGDVLVADVHFIQQQEGMKITSERHLVKVHDHKLMPRQAEL